MSFLSPALEGKLRSICEKTRGDVSLVVRVEAVGLNWECSVEVPVPADAIEWLWAFGEVTGMNDKDVIKTGIYRLLCEAVEYVKEERRRRNRHPVVSHR